MERVRAAVSSHLADEGPYLLAVSGGLDSMVLLDAAVAAVEADPAVVGRSRLVVATFDHGTGTPARRAAALVRRVARARGVVVRGGRFRGDPPVANREAIWRLARWDFLRQVAADVGARVVTAHTRDDQLETIVLRLLRGSGARGLSALATRSEITRPLLTIGRGDVQAYARARGLTWVEDPSNLDRRFARNRVRHDLLPALLAARASLGAELIHLAEQVAELRLQAATWAQPLVVSRSAGSLLARGVTDAQWPLDARAFLWQSLAEQAGIALDWRGTTRLAHFSADGRRGRRIPLAGGYEAVHRGDAIELRPARHLRTVQGTPAVLSSPASPSGALALGVDGRASFGRWRFRPESAASELPGAPNDPWRAWLPSDRPTVVRAWRAGDRMDSSGAGPRRVKRYFADQRVAAEEREGWPVVEVDGEIVWIPGVRRGRAATARSGRSHVCIVCERLGR